MKLLFLNVESTHKEIFPGRNAGASLKLGQVDDGLAIRQEIFPGRNAGASLKLAVQVQHEKPGRHLPRQKCRGLIEAM